MSGFSGSYSHSAGDRFIFKGGVTWTSSCFQMQIQAGGSSGSPDYYGFDANWFAGSQWSRPVFDGETAALAGAQRIIYIEGERYITIDNLDVRRLLVNNSSPWNGGSIAIDGCQNIVISNCWVHYWYRSGLTSDADVGGIIGNSAGTPAVGNIVDSCLIENSEGQGDFGTCVRQFNLVNNSILHDAPNLIGMGGGNVTSNTFYNCTPSFDPSMHENVMYIALWDGATTKVTTIAQIHHNVVKYNAGGAEQCYLEPCFGGNDGTILFYDNLVYRPGVINRPVEVDPEQGSGACGTVFVFNNTLVDEDQSNVVLIRTTSNHSGSNNIKTLSVINNHYITDNTSPTDFTGVSNLTNSNNLRTSIAMAASQGYTTNNGYRPTTINSITVDKGVSLATFFNADILGVSRPQGASWDVGAYEFVDGGSRPAPPTGLHIVAQ